VQIIQVRNYVCYIHPSAGMTGCRTFK